MRRPDPFDEIRLLLLRVIPYPNYWSRSPVVRLDLAPGGYDEISSADVPGLTESLVESLPGLREHRCSVGARGGFIERLRRGTYAPHIIEHVSLELQTMIGHAVGFGRARGGERDGEYTVVIGYAHPEVGRAAAGAALDIVRAGLAGRDLPVEDSLASLHEAATRPPPEAPTASPDCLLVGGDPGRFDVASCLDDSTPCGIEYTEMLAEGLRYERCGSVIVTDLDRSDLPPRYQEEERFLKLASVAGDAVREGGWIAVPESAGALIARFRGDGLHTLTYPGGGAGRRIEAVVGNPPERERISPGHRLP